MELLPPILGPTEECELTLEVRPELRTELVKPTPPNYALTLDSYRL